MNAVSFQNLNEQKYENEYDEYGGHYAEYQKHSNCGRQINFETEYAEYECGRSETDSTKMNKKKKKLCIRCSVLLLVLFLLGKKLSHGLSVRSLDHIFYMIDIISYILYDIYYLT